MTTAARQAAQTAYNANLGPGGVAPSASQATPSQVSNAVSTAIGGAVTASGNLTTGGKANPKDLPGYVPGSSPTDKLDTSGVASAQTPPQSTTATTGAPQPTTQPAPTGNLNPTDQAPQGLVDSVNQAQTLADQLKQKYTKAFTDLSKSGVASPSNQGSANAGVQAALNSQPKVQKEPETPPAVTSFLDPSTNPQLDEQTKNLREFLSPAADRQALTDSMAQLKTDKSELAGLKTELMNVKRIMAGSQQDIEDEVTKAGGTISASLLANMTIARNRALIVQGQNLQDQIQTATDLVATDTTLVGDEKQLAQQQFTNNMSLLQYQQTNYNNQLNAAKDSIKLLLGPNMENAQAVYNSVKGTAYESRYEQILGLPKGGMAQLAAIKPKDTFGFMKGDDGVIYKTNSRTGEITAANTGDNSTTSVKKETQRATTKSNIDQITSLQNVPNLANAVGTNALSRVNLKNMFTNEKSDFIAGVEQLRSQLNLDTLIKAKGQGATFGALSDNEGRMLASAATKIGTWAIKDGDGNVVGYKATPQQFKAELDKINNFAKLDYILKGGSAEEVGATTLPDGHVVVKNSDGTVTQLK